MQDIKSSLFAGGIERRLNTAYHHGFADGHGGSLKCPRCGSSNTKFCYYNNYNLSQPRFFCKGCRRYWTKGGVLRNVPIGGGSRKTKRSKQKTANGKPSSVNLATTSERKPTDSQNSSSDSSVVVANISPEMKPTEAVPKMFNQSFEPPMQTDSHQLFSEIGINFRSLMTSSIDELGLGFILAPPEVSSVTQQVDQDQVVENNNWSNNGGTAAEDWGLFDQSYWLSNSDHQLNYLV